MNAIGRGNSLGFFELLMGRWYYEQEMCTLVCVKHICVAFYTFPLSIV